MFGTIAPMLAQTVPMAPAAILVLCVVAGVGTVLLLPGRREASIRKIGGAVLIATLLIAGALLLRSATGDSAARVGAYFWIFSAIALCSAVRVITHPKPVYSALYFILTVFATAGLFLLLHAEFMAAALVLIYAGAILITYVFVIMLAAEASNTSAAESLDHDSLSREPILASAVGFALMGVILFVIFDKYQAISRVPSPEGPDFVKGATQQLGAYLFTTQILTLELAGLILTVAMVGAIVIAQRKIPGAEMPGELPAGGEVILGPATPVNDNPHSIPVYGTSNVRQKAYPEN
jgi:NADH-quinone oxidoreductase subunit J